MMTNATIALATKRSCICKASMSIFHTASDVFLFCTLILLGIYGRFSQGFLRTAVPFNRRLHGTSTLSSSKAITSVSSVPIEEKNGAVIEANREAFVALSNGLRARRVDVPYLRHDLLDQLSGRPVSFYEIVNWDIKEGNQSFYLANSFTYGGKVWPSNLAIAKRMCTEKRLVKDKIVLDAGCGVGLSAIVAGLLDARKVIAMDISKVCLELVQAAGRRHKLDNVDLCEFDLLSSEPLPEADVVLFGDVLYTPELGKAVARRVREAQARGSYVLLGSMPHRHGKPWFLQELNSDKYDAEKIEFFPDCSLSKDVINEMGWKGKEIEMIELNRPPPAVFLVQKLSGVDDEDDETSASQELTDLIKNSDIPRAPETEEEIEDESFEGFLKMQFTNIADLDNGATKNSDGKSVISFARYFEWKSKMGLVLKEAEVMDVFNILTGDRGECTLMEFIAITKAIDESNAAMDENEEGFFF